MSADCHCTASMTLNRVSVAQLNCHWPLEITALSGRIEPIGLASAFDSFRKSSKDNRLARDQVIEVRAALGTSVVNHLIESLPAPENHGAHRTAGWRGWLPPDRRVVDRDRMQPVHAASIPFRIPSLKDRINSDQRNVPVGFMGMKTGHLFKQEQHFAKLRLRHI